MAAFAAEAPFVLNLNSSLCAAQNQVDEWLPKHAVRLAEQVDVQDPAALLAAAAAGGVSSDAGALDIAALLGSCLSEALGAGDGLDYYGYAEGLTSQPPMLPPPFPQGWDDVPPPPSWAASEFEEALHPYMQPSLSADAMLPFGYPQLQMSSMGWPWPPAAAPTLPAPALPPSMPPALPPSALPPAMPPAMPPASPPLASSPPPPSEPPALPPSLPASFAGGDGSERGASDCSPPSADVTRVSLVDFVDGVGSEGLASDVLDFGIPERPPPGLEPPLGVPTHGSTLHSTGRCRPCAWFHKPSGCTNGQECGHCHLCPPGVRKSRRKARAAGAAGVELPLKVAPADASPSNSIAALSTTAGSGSEHGSPAAGYAMSLQGDDHSSADDEGSVTRELCFPSDLQAALSASTPSTSVGSALHGEGICRPCAWFWKAVGCQNATECGFCHSCPAGEVKARKKQREAQKRSVTAKSTAAHAAAAC